jgi:hypothetical protein
MFYNDVISDYQELARRALAKGSPEYPQISCVCPSWDNSARRKSGALVLANSTPKYYELWLREVVSRQAARIAEDENSDVSPESLVFINVERMGRGKSS